MQEARQQEPTSTQLSNLPVDSKSKLKIVPTIQSAAKPVAATVVSFVFTKLVNGLERVARFVEVKSETDE